MYKNKKSGIIGIIVTIVILIVIVFLSNVEVGQLSDAQNVFTSLIMPVQNGLTYLKNKLSGNDSFFTDINRLQEENEELKQKNKELEESLRGLEITKNENERLTELLGLTEKYSNYTTIPAYVINRDMNNYSNMIVIDVGAKDGIKENMVVIADKGLVGHVVSVSDTTAKVQTIIDPSSTVSSTLTTTRDNIIVRGSIEGESRLKGTYIQPDVLIAEGDSIETSGIGGIYPKGIHIGVVKQVIPTKNTTDRYVWIETAVDFTKLETVLVIE